ncbi:hypothetical protein ID858_02560 [Xenorhabdus sp. DI]|uniref:hypothetical protein n=1 Tax=Xenorhabdus doucetiae TaxID=351671 RepID=UPI0019A65877|nr:MULTISPECIES: hypothetical protein [unclassified Xenorhabdus]MBD2784859.1 hypothetical protein [Xenorhabdus sp. 3]MBD2787394.1 hypothetical protein [Xenorhabdus sp. DI]
MPGIGAVWLIGVNSEKNKKVFARNIKGSFLTADKTVGGNEHRGQTGPNSIYRFDFKKELYHGISHQY